MALAVVKTMPNYAEFFARFHFNSFSIRLAPPLGAWRSRWLKLCRTMQNSLPASILTCFPFFWLPPCGLPLAVVKTMPNYAEFFSHFHSNLFSVVLAPSLWHAAGGG